MSCKAEKDQRDAERLERQRMIAAFALEMQTTTPIHSVSATPSAVAIDPNAVVLGDAYVEESSTAASSSSISSSYVARSEPVPTATQPSILSKDDMVNKIATDNNIPISHSVELIGHTKACVAISFEPSGSRVVTGSLDYNTQIYDFGGMDSRHRPFRSLEAEDGHPVTSLSHSPSGDRFVVASGSCQPKVYDREAIEIIKFCRGDMYIRDLSNTKGHTMEVTGVAWHPSDKNIILTSSMDGSMRIWDLLGEAHFGCLMNKSVLKIRSDSGQARLGASCCCYSKLGSRMVGGGADGSVHVFFERKIYGKADIIIRPCHAPTATVTSVLLAKDDYTLVTRATDNNVLVWDLRKPKAPVKVIPNVVNKYTNANAELSPDEKIICLCGTVNSGDKSEKSLIYFYSLKGNSNRPILQLPVTSQQTAEPKTAASGEQAARLQLESIGADGAPAVGVVVRWNPVTNQIFATLSNGCIKVFYSPLLSTKGALLTAGKKARKETSFLSGDNVVVGEILNPNALPMYKQESSFKRKAAELRDPIKMKVPENKEDKGPSNRTNTNFFFTNYVTSGKEVTNIRGEDPREALLKYDAVARADPVYTSAYAATQPKNILAEKTFEEEQEEFLKEQKKAL